MTGYKSKRAAAQDKLAQPAQEPWPEEPFGHMAGGVQPPQRSWVGLTDEDCKGMSAGDKVIAMWAARNLKEKNK